MEDGDEGTERCHHPLQVHGESSQQRMEERHTLFDLDSRPVLKVACGRHRGPLAEFADRWGWAEIETDWRQVVRRDDIDIVDISAPPIVHHDIALEAVRAGKHVFCESQWP